MCTFKHRIFVVLMLVFEFSCEQNKTHYFIGNREVTKTEYEAKHSPVKLSTPKTLEDAIIDLEAAILDPNYHLKYNHKAMLDSLNPTKPDKL